MYSCENCIEKFANYIDNELGGKELELFNEHIAVCEACRNELQNLVLVTSELASLPELELPGGFHEFAMQKIKAETNRKKLFSNSRAYAYAAAGMAAVLIAVSAGMAALGEHKNSASEKKTATELSPYIAESSIMPSTGIVARHSSGDPADDAADVENMPENSGATKLDEVPPGLLFAGGMTAALTVEAQPMQTSVTLKNSRVSIEVEDMDSAVEEIELLPGETLYQNITDNVNSDNAVINIQVSEADYTLAMEQIKNLGKVQNESENTVVLIDEVIVNSATLGAKTAEYSRLLELLNKAEDVSAMLSVEARLNQLANEIDNCSAKQMTWIANEQNPLIQISINEKANSEAFTERKSFGDRIAQGFVNSVNGTTAFFSGLIVFASYAFIPAVIIAALLIALYILVGKRGAR